MRHSILLFFLGLQTHASDCQSVAQDMAGFDTAVAEMKTKFDRLPSKPNDKEWVTQKISHMVEVDQYLRTAAMHWPHEKKYNEEEAKCFWAQLSPRWQKIDSSNTKDLRVLMQIYGWFKISEFGSVTSQQAWLLVQHADLDRPFQREVLGILEKLYPLGEVLPADYAYLYDRVLWYADHKPQRYATQGRCLGPANWQPWETEDFENVNARRSAMGMESFEDNKARLDQVCH